MLLVLSACTNTSQKPTEDSLLATEAMELAQAIAADYSAGDFSALQTRCTPEAYTVIKAELREFQSAELEFMPEWVDIAMRGEVELRLEWRASWVLRGGNSAEHSGKTVLRMSGTPLRLDAITRGSPFKHPASAAPKY